MKFASEFKDDEDEPSLLEKISKASKEYLLTDDHIEGLQEEIERVVKMFYLHMKVKGQLKPYKDDYFI